MLKRKIILSTICLLVISCICAYGEEVTTHWGGDAEMIYDTGFIERLMRHGDRGVCLFDMDLIQNDAPGASYSDKGVNYDAIWGPNRARKVHFLDDPRTEKAWLVIYPYRYPAGYPLTYSINGNEGRIEVWDHDTETRELYHWVKFPAEWLKKGKNVIDFSCPDAKNEEEGWTLQLARADEFVYGGGDPAHVGETSFKSFNGGKSWKESPFGENQDIRAEYNVRLSLDRYVKTGWLASPVIDLWRGDSQDFIVPLHHMRETHTIRLTISSDVPGETAVEYYYRKGTDPSPYSEEWEPYVHIGSGQQLDFAIDGTSLNRRYFQFKAVLSTDNPLKSPVIRSARVSAELNKSLPLHKNIYVLKTDNPQIQYSSAGWEWEKWDRPEFQELIKRENLEEVVKGSKTQFGAQVSLMDYATHRWYIGGPYGEYPDWNSLSIVKRINKAGRGGMCIQYNLFMAGLFIAHGWQAKFSNTVGHEVIEVWSDEFGKWIFMDATCAVGAYANHYNFLNENGEPQSLYELHNLWLDYFFPDRAIDWMHDWINWSEVVDGKPFPVSRGSRAHPKRPSNDTRTFLTGFSNAAHLRCVTRNNWYEKPYPRPLNHGRSWWPWDGYLNWYDERTPRNRQYSWHTDRPRDMWPDLNKVHIDATSSFANDRLFLHFETYTPNFSHFEVRENGDGWKETLADWTWFPDSGRNTLEVRAVSKAGVKGKPSSVVINHADVISGEYIE